MVVEFDETEADLDLNDSGAGVNRVCCCFFTLANTPSLPGTEDGSMNSPLLVFFMFFAIERSELDTGVKDKLAYESPYSARRTRRSSCAEAVKNIGSSPSLLLWLLRLPLPLRQLPS
jgi:hypothetical protein